MFHLLRRQVLRAFRRPLVVMSPKSLLRHKLSVSALADLCDHGFRNVIGEVDPIDPNRVERVVLCGGKVYFDLLEARRTNGLDNVAILRIEQLYPFPREELQALLRGYPNAREVTWVQEEPRNQGAWFYLLSREHLPNSMEKHQKLNLVARPYSASPAVGYLSVHLEQQLAVVNEALRIGAVSIAQKKSA
jgi:2-oxoglutarate dehydrogenase E1 component